MFAFTKSFWVDFGAWWSMLLTGDVGGWGIVYLIFTLVLLYGLDGALGRPLHKVLDKFGRVIQWLVEHAILPAFLFYFIFAPVAIICRLLGKDLMGLKIDKKSETHWLEKEKQDLSPEDYERSG